MELSAITSALRRSGATAWIVSLSLALFVFSRAPHIYQDRELNPDESLMIAQAMRFERDMTPWRSVDSSTSGPLNSWFLVGVHKLGLPYNYRSVHLVAALSLAATLLAGWIATRRLIGPTPAAAALALVCFWMAMMPARDFSHYSSEIVPCLLMAVAFAAAALTAATSRYDHWKRFAAGFLLGLVPWAKLQAAPIALAFGLWAMLHEHELQPGPARRKALLGSLAVLTTAALLPTVLMVGWLHQTGTLDYALDSYIRVNLAYAGERSWPTLLADAARLLLQNLFLSLALALLWLVVLLRMKPWKGLSWRTVLLAGLLALAGAVALLRPHTQFRHYQLLVLVPVLFMTAIALRPLLDEPSPAGRPDVWRRRKRFGFAGLLLFLVALPLLRGVRSHVLYYREVFNRPLGSPEMTVEVVRPYLQNRDSISVWGWAPAMYVASGIAPATRHATNPFLVGEPLGLRSLRASYMSDLRASHPELIVSVNNDLSRWATKTLWPPVQFIEYEEYVRQNYHSLMSRSFFDAEHRQVEIQVFERNGLRRERK